jgi:hypothetical protein
MSVSIVVTSRNDGYGGTLELRASHALNTMIKNYDEVIYVDWNSPNDDSLINHLSLNGKGNLRHIQIKKEDVERINPVLVDLPIVEVLGRNIGIKRAKSDWIVSSNIDIMPDKLNTSNLQEDTFYAVSRKNVPVSFFQSVEKDFFSYCLKNSTKFESAPKIIGDHWAGKYDPWSLTVCCGDFQVAHRNLWEKMRGFEESLIYRDCADSNIMKKGVIYGRGASLIDMNVFHLDHDGHSMNVGGKTLKNEWEPSVANFEETTNKENWGLFDFNFKEEII